MAWASKKQYAILMGSEEGKDLAEKLPDMEQEEFQDAFAELLGKSGGNTTSGEQTNKINDLKNKIKEARKNYNSTGDEKYVEEERNLTDQVDKLKAQKFDSDMYGTTNESEEPKETAQKKQDKKLSDNERLQKIIEKRGYDYEDPQFIEDTGYLGWGSLDELEKATFKTDFNNIQEKIDENNRLADAGVFDKQIEDNVTSLFNSGKYDNLPLDEMKDKIYQDSIASIHSADKIGDMVEKLYNEKQKAQANEDKGYAKGTSKQYTDQVNKEYNEASNYLKKQGIDASQFKSFKDVTHYMKDFLKKWEKEGNDDKNEPIFDALDKIFDKFANDDYNKKAPWGRN